MPVKPKVFEYMCRAQIFSSTIRRGSAALLLLFAMSVAASAYTVVMRGGRHIEIPENFAVTRATLTYEAAPGINVTLQMSAIDIAATERINKEPVGSLLRRAEAQWPTPSPEADAAATAPLQPQPQPRARRTITNRDLEASRRARERNEEAYERRAQELGLPSLDDMHRRNQEETRRLGELSRRFEEEASQAEVYWRSRAAELRTETAVVDAQINYLRNQLAASSRPLTLSSYPIVTSIGPRFPFRRRGPTPFIPRGTHAFGTTGPGARPVAVASFGGGSTRGQVLATAASPYEAYGRQTGYITPRVIVPAINPFFVNYPADDSSYERSVLITRLRELESVRAGLSARWRLLEDEARRAGAMPGWLRP